MKLLFKSLIIISVILIVISIGLLIAKFTIMA